MNPLLNVGVKAAREAGTTILRYVDQLHRLNVEKKGRNDFVSEVDRMAEDIIIETIRKGYPDHAILAEESGHSEGADSKANDAVTWIIDPLDGTTNFLHGHPDFCVSIGIQEQGRIQHGIVFDPLRNELFTASQNQGAQLNGRRIRVSGQGSLRASLVTIGYPAREREGYDTWHKCFSTLVPKCASIRHTGSAALDLVYVASGRTDAFFEPALKPWDIAAGSLIVREAKGLVSDFAGNQDFMDSGNILCANPRIFNDLLKHIVEHYAQ